ncbi:MAG: IPT/TIG domain-containing protein, partial [Acidimicrobiales bacterium]
SGGTKVTITGTNFDTASGTTTVDFGSGNPATPVICATSSSCTATSPAGSGTVSVTVTTAGGTSNGVSYTYIPAGSPPTITSISPTSGPTSGGTKVTITGTNFDTASGTTTVDFGSGNPATPVICATSSSCTAVSPSVSTPGVVDLIVSTPNGISSPSGFVYVTSNIPYVPVTPYRIADTRCSASSQPSYCAGEHLPSQNAALLSPSAGGSILVQATGTGSGSNAVPSGAQSVVVTVTAIAGGFAHAGYLTVYPAGTNPPTASSLNYITGAVIPNLVTAALGKGGAMSIYSSSGQVNVVVDVEGYYEPSPSNVNMFDPLPVPIRALDTRCSTSPQPSYCAGENLPSQNASASAPGPKSAIPVDVVGIGGNSGIPSSGVAAVSLVLTAAGPSSGGYLTIWPDQGSCITPPPTSNVNFHEGTASANSVIVEVGSSGKLCVYNSAGTPTNVVVDANGYFSTAGDALTPSSPVRICDTRSFSTPDVTSGVTGQCNNSGTSLSPSSGPITVQVTGIGGIPTSAKAVVANVTVASVAGSGYIQVWAAGGSQPSTSNINWSAGEIIPNMVISKLSSSGQISVYASAGANVIVDVVGWYS